MTKDRPFGVPSPIFLFLLRLCVVLLIAGTGGLLSPAAETAPAAEKPEAGASVKTVLPVLAGEESLGPNLLVGDFGRYRDGFVADGAAFICDNGDDGGAHRGVAKGMTVHQEIPKPFFASAESKAEGVEGIPNPDYSIYVDLVYEDGTTLWGQSKPFSVGSHDWERKEFFIIPTKPVKSLSFYTLFRNHRGKASFRNLSLRELKTDSSPLLFDTLALTGRTPLPEGRVSFQLRNVLDHSDFLYLGDETDAASDGGPADNNPADNDSSDDGKGTMTALGVDVRVKAKKGADEATFYSLALQNRSGEDRILTLLVSFPLPKENVVWLESGLCPNGPKKAAGTKPVESGREYFYGGVVPVGANGRLSRWPFGAVTWGSGAGAGGVFLGIDPDYPAFYRVFYNEPTGELALAFDVALTAERPDASLEFLRADFAPGDGFGGALEVYRDLYPDAFVRRTASMGNWMPFAKISEIPNWEDFGFKFKEGNDETAWDDEHGIITFRYTEPMTWWMRLDKGAPRTIDAGVEKARELADKGDRAAMALFTSGHRDAEGQFRGIPLDTPWCDGLVWSLNDMPGLARGVADGTLEFADRYPVSGFGVKWSEKTADSLYGPPITDAFGTGGVSGAGDWRDWADLRAKTRDKRSEEDRKIIEAFGDSAPKAGLDGEYIDSSEGYVTAILDYDRSHFPFADRPLAYDRETRAPGIFRGLIAFEYARQMAADVHNRGKLMMANSTPGMFFWLVPSLDVAGTETNWNQGGKWSPMSLDQLYYRRAILGKKPYCFLMNTDFSQFSYEASEKYMRRSLAFGMFPGFFSANASTGHYFKNPDLFERDRPLFKRYLPLIRRVAEAGWEPVPLAAADDPEIFVQRFGDGKEIFLTLLNTADEPKEGILTLDPRLAERLGGKISWRTDLLTGDRRPFEGEKIEWKLDAGETGGVILE